MYESTTLVICLGQVLKYNPSGLSRACIHRYNDIDIQVGELPLFILLFENLQISNADFLSYMNNKVQIS